MKLLSKFLFKERKIKIDFCEKNLDRFLTDENAANYDSFLSQKNIEYKEYHCQSKCEQCEKSPYAIVNGDFINAENSAELLEKLKYEVNKRYK